MRHRTRFATLALAALSFASPALAASSPARADHGRGSISLGKGLHAYLRCAPRQVAREEWVPGHYETRCERVWVPGCTRTEWVPARYETRFDACGRPFSFCVRAGYWATVTDPGRYEIVETRVWIGGHWRWVQ